MKSVILAFQNPEAAGTIQRVVQSGGYNVSAVCTSGAEVLRIARRLDQLIVICSYRLPDMTAGELYEHLPGGAGLLVLLSQSQQSGYDMPYGILSLRMPVSKSTLMETLRTVDLINDRPSTKRSGDAKPPRSEVEKEVISSAKQVLMERDHMSEEQAHRFIQRISMNNGKKMIDTAQMILAGEMVY